jgi:hypothetical protein
MKKLTKIILYCIGILLVLAVGSLFYYIYQVSITTCSDELGIGCSGEVTYDHYCSIESKNKDRECTDEWDPVIGDDGQVHSNSCYACSINGVDAWNYAS